MQKYIEINNSIINEILNQINKNSFLKDYHLTLMDVVQKKELNLLQRKRENEHLNNDFAIQKENFTIQKNELGNARNEWPYLINFGANNCIKS